MNKQDCEDKVIALYLLSGLDGMSITRALSIFNEAKLLLNATHNVNIKSESFAATLKEWEDNFNQSGEKKNPPPIP